MKTKKRSNTDEKGRGDQTNMKKNSMSVLIDGVGLAC